MENNCTNLPEKGFKTPLNSENMDPNDPNMEMTCEDSITFENPLKKVNFKNNYTFDLNLTDTGESSSGDASVCDLTLKNKFKKLIDIQNKNYSVELNLNETSINSEPSILEQNQKAIIFNSKINNLNSIELSLNDSVLGKSQEQPLPEIEEQISSNIRTNTIYDSQKMEITNLNYNNTPPHSNKHECVKQKNCFQKPEMDEPKTQDESNENNKMSQLSTEPKIDNHSIFQDNHAKTVFDSQMEIIEPLQKSAILEPGVISGTQKQKDPDTLKAKNQRMSELQKSFHNTCAETVCDSQEMELTETIQKSAIGVVPATQEMNSTEIKDDKSTQKPENAPKSQENRPDTKKGVEEIQQHVQKSKNKRMSELREQKSVHNTCTETVCDSQEMEITETIQKSAIGVVPATQEMNSTEIKDDKSTQKPENAPKSQDNRPDTEKSDEKHSQKSKNKRMSELQKSFHNTRVETVFDSQEMEITEAIQNKTIEVVSTTQEKNSKEIKDDKSTQKPENAPKSQENRSDTKKGVEEIQQHAQKSKNKRMSELPEQKSVHNTCTETVCNIQEMEITETIQKSAIGVVSATQEMNSTEIKDDKSTQKPENAPKSQDNRPDTEKSDEKHSQKSKNKRMSELQKSFHNTRVETVFDSQEMEITEAIQNGTIEVVSTTQEKNSTEIKDDKSTQKPENAPKSHESKPDTKKTHKIPAQLSPNSTLNEKIKSSETFDSSLRIQKNVLMDLNFLKNKKMSVQIDFNKTDSDVSLNESNLNQKAKIFHHNIPPKDYSLELNSQDETKGLNTQDSSPFTIPEKPLLRYSRVNKSEYTICLSLDSTSDFENSSIPNLENQLVLQKCTVPVLRKSQKNLEQNTEPSKSDKNTSSDSCLAEPIRSEININELHNDIIQEQNLKNNTLSLSQEILNMSKGEDRADVSLNHFVSTPELGSTIEKNMSTENAVNSSNIESPKNDAVQELNINNITQDITNTTSELKRSRGNLKNVPKENAGVSALKIELPESPKNDAMQEPNINNITQDITNTSKVLRTSERKRSKGSVKNVPKENPGVSASKIELPESPKNDAMQEPNINNITQDITNTSKVLRTSERKRSRGSVKNVPKENPGVSALKIELPESPKNDAMQEPNINNITQDITNTSKVLRTSERKRSRGIVKNVPKENTGVSASKIELPESPKNDAMQEPNINNITQDITNTSKVLRASERKKSRGSVKNVPKENPGVSASKIELPESPKNDAMQEPNINNITQDITNTSKVLRASERKKSRGSVKNVPKENAGVSASKIELPESPKNDAMQEPNINNITQDITNTSKVLRTSERKKSRGSVKNVPKENAGVSASKIELPESPKNDAMQEPNINNITQDITNTSKVTSELRRSGRSIRNVSVVNAGVSSSKIELLESPKNDAAPDTEISQPNSSKLLSASELRRSKRSIKNVSVGNTSVSTSIIEVPELPKNDAAQDLNTEISQPNITQDITHSSKALSNSELRKSKRSIRNVSVGNASVSVSKIEVSENLKNDAAPDTEISQPNLSIALSNSELRKSKRSQKNVSGEKAGPSKLHELSKNEVSQQDISKTNASKNISTSLRRSKRNIEINNSVSTLFVKNTVKSREIKDLNNATVSIVSNFETADMSEIPKDLPDEENKISKNQKASDNLLQISKKNRTSSSLNESKKRGFVNSKKSDKSNDSTKFNFTRPQMPKIDLNKGKSEEGIKQKKITFRPSDENSIINCLSLESSKNSTEHKARISKRKICDLSDDTSLDISAIPQENKNKKRLIITSTPIRKRSSQSLSSQSGTSVPVIEEQVLIQEELNNQEDVMYQEEINQEDQEEINQEDQEEINQEDQEEMLEQVEVELNEQTGASSLQFNNETDVSVENTSELDTSSETDLSLNFTSDTQSTSSVKRKIDESVIFPPLPKKRRTTEKKPQLPKLFKPVKWINKKFYDYLEKKLKPKYQLNTRKVSEEFAIFLFSTYSLVINGHDKESAISGLKNKLKELNLCTNNMDYCMFIYEFLPFDFRKLVLPMGGAYGTKPGPKMLLYGPL